MSSKSVRWAAALLATVVGIIVLPFAIPGYTGVGGVSAFASGTVLHADLLKVDATKLVDAEVAFSGAAFDSGGLQDAIFNEMDRMFAPKLPAKLSVARGAGLEVGLGVSPTTENQMILAGKAEASALPNVGRVTEGAGPIDIDPLVWADVLRGQALANASDNGCALGTDASNGFAYVADAQLLDSASQTQTTSTTSSAPTASQPSSPVEQTVDTVKGLLGDVTQTAEAPAENNPVPSASTSTNTAQSNAMPNAAGLENPVISLDAPGPERAISHSRSRTVFVAQKDRDGHRLGNAFGIMSEVRETIAPITLFKGTSNQLTIEFLGEWVLQAVAGGLPGTGYVHYGPNTDTPDTPVLRLIGAHENRVLTLQDLVTDDGLVITIPDVAEVAIGEPPRAIDGAANSDPTVVPGGTKTAAAVDVVRVKALPGADIQLADLRIGHMEASAQVPAGGVSCSIPVSKTPSAQQVNVGHFFDVTFKITNPYDCTLTGVRLEDVTTTEDDARFTVMATDPVASSVPQGEALDSGTITWADIGDMAAHSTRTVKARIGARGGSGVIVDKATASGTLAGCAEPGASVAGVDVGVVGSGLTGTSGEVRVPAVDTRVLAASGRNLPFTGAPILFMVAAALVLIAAGSASLLQASRLR